MIFIALGIASLGLCLVIAASIHPTTDPKRYSFAHGLTVLLGATLTACCYISLRSSSAPLTIADKFWCALPLLVSLVATDRCIFVRLGRLIQHSRKAHP